MKCRYGSREFFHTFFDIGTFLFLSAYWSKKKRQAYYYVPTSWSRRIADPSFCGSALWNTVFYNPSVHFSQNNLWALIKITGGTGIYGAIWCSLIGALVEECQLPLLSTCFLVCGFTYLAGLCKKKGKLIPSNGASAQGLERTKEKLRCGYRFSNQTGRVFTPRHCWL